MIKCKQNNDSAVPLNKDDLDFDNFSSSKSQQQFQYIDIQSPIQKNSTKHTFLNPFTRNEDPSQKTQSQQNDQKSNFNEGSQIRLSKNSFYSKKDKIEIAEKQQQVFGFPSKSDQQNEEFVFLRRSDSEKKKGSLQFNFEGSASSSLFGTQKTEQSDDREGRFKNLQKYRVLLKEYYNDGYLKNNYNLKRRSTLGRSIRGSEVANFITRQPIMFYKKFYGSRSGYDLSGNFLCRLVGNKIFYKNVTNEDLQNGQQIKCECIQIPKEQSISPSIQIDSSSMHLFYFSNSTNQLVVMSLDKYRKKSNNQICRIKTRTQRKNPLLYLIEINKQIILLLIGGYTPLGRKQNSDQVEGCKYIEVFPVDKWGTQIMESRVIKLINGKIYPLVIFPVKIENNDSLLLIGGNTLAKIVKGKLSFKEYKVFNRSSNVRAVFINTKHIIESIEQTKDIMSLPNSNNISVQVEDKVNLYKGYVDYVRSTQKQKIRLFLPKMKEFYTLKILKKQLRIIKSKQTQQRLLTFDSNQEYHHLEMKCFRKPTTKYYQINQKGLFQQKIIELTNNSLQIKRTYRCPCEFM